MKLLVCGDRNWSDENKIFYTLVLYPKDTILIHGDARGADKIAGKIGEVLGFTIKTFPANWSKYGRAAGPIRNMQMLDTKPNLVIAFHSDIQNSKGTLHCITNSKKRNIPVQLIK